MLIVQLREVTKGGFNNGNEALDFFFFFSYLSKVAWIENRTVCLRDLGTVNSGVDVEPALRCGIPAIPVLRCLLTGVAAHVHISICIYIHIHRDAHIYSYMYIRTCVYLYIFILPCFEVPCHHISFSLSQMYYSCCFLNPVRLWFVKLIGKPVRWICLYLYFCFWEHCVCFFFVLSKCVLFTVVHCICLLFVIIVYVYGFPYHSLAVASVKYLPVLSNVSFIQLPLAHT